MRKSVFLALCVVALFGCHAKYQVNNLAASEIGRLDRRKAVYIAIPIDASYGSKKYAGSGQIVTQELANAFSRAAARVQIAEKSMATTEEVVAAAARADAGYAVIPTIAHWEQRATEWSGRPSRMAIRVVVLDAATGKQVSSTAVEGRSRIFSFTSTSPESLLKEPLATYVSGIY